MQYVTDLNETVMHPHRLLQEDSGAKRDPPIEISYYVLDAAGSELGFFFFLMFGCILVLLNQVDGKLFRIKIFLMNRDFHLLNNDGFVRVIAWILKMMSWLSLLLPFMSLGVWAAGLLIKAADYGEKPTGGICVLLVGMAFFWFCLGVFKIKWNHYQFTIFNGLCLFLCFLHFTGYQFVSIFMDDNSSFFGYSAIFLCVNCMIMIVIVYLNSGIHEGSMRFILSSLVEKGEPRDENRDMDFIEEINEEKANKQYYPSFHDIIDLFTIAKVSDQSLDSVFGGGLQFRYSQLSKAWQRTISMFLWCCATAILVVYSYVIKWNMGGSSLGFVVMVTVLVTDVILYAIYNSKIVETATPLAIILFLNRLLLFVFGGDYWIYGYLALYIIYSVMLSIVITKRRFPFENAFSNMSLDNISGQKSSLDVSKVPEFLMAVITGIYAGVFTILYVVEPEGVPLKYLDIDDWEYPYYINGVFCLLLVCSFFCHLAAYRLFMRKKKRIEPKMQFYIKTRKFDTYWIFIILCMLLNLTIGLIGYWITDSVSYCLVIFLVTIFVLLEANAYLHYMLNDYNVLQDITLLNAKIQKHNERITDIKQKVIQFKQDLREGKTDKIGEASLGLAQNILKQDKVKKEQQRTKKKIE